MFKRTLGLALLLSFISTAPVMAEEAREPCSDQMHMNAGMLVGMALSEVVRSGLMEFVRPDDSSSALMLQMVELGNADMYGRFLSSYKQQFGDEN